LALRKVGSGLSSVVFMNPSVPNLWDGRPCGFARTRQILELMKCPAPQSGHVSNFCGLKQDRSNEENSLFTNTVHRQSPRSSTLGAQFS
jgi:hypothetical protein